MGGANDVAIAGGILVFLSIVGVFIYFISIDFHNATVGDDPRDVVNYVPNFDSPTSLMSSLYDLYVIPFTTIPWWVWLFVVVPCNIALGFIIARNIWVGGGA